MILQLLKAMPVQTKIILVLGFLAFLATTHGIAFYKGLAWQKARQEVAIAKAKEEARKNIIATERAYEEIINHTHNADGGNDLAGPLTSDALDFLQQLHGERSAQ